MNKQVVRSSYEGCLDATARLSAYVTSKPFTDALETNARQDVLAANDLVVFCIHARRLIENVGLKDMLNNKTMEASDKSRISLLKIIGCLIHHDELIIIRDQTRFRMLQATLDGTTGEDFFNRVKDEIKKPSYSEPITPHVLFKSDKIHYTLINLAQFIQIFSEEVILEVIKKANNQGLHLQDDPLRDFDQNERSRILSRARAIEQQRSK